MSASLALIIAGAAALVALLILFRLTKTFVWSLILAVGAAVGLYFALPKLEQQDGPVGEAAREIREQLERLIDEAKQLDVVDQLREAVDDAARDTANDAADSVGRFLERSRAPDAGTDRP